MIKKKKNPRGNRHRLSLFSGHSFWELVGDEFPSLAGAPSTRFYFECEKRLFKKYLHTLRSSWLFKTDLWDEAKNTQILMWAAEQGAIVYGIDISSSILIEAKKYFVRRGIDQKFVVSDMRNVGFADESFDLIYSMGTIEHFPEYRQAVKECFRILKRGGIGIIGVPNKYDPFLRPSMVTVLNRLNLYAYGYEKSFSFKELERILTGVGFQVKARDGILFIPGWLRMLDLLLHVNWPKSALLTSPLVAFFSFLSKQFPSLSRHGYLIASIVQKPL